LNNIKELFLRLFVETSDSKEAHQIAGQVKTLIEKHANIKKIKVEEYWKIPEDYEIFFLMDPKRTPEACFNNIMNSLAEGWAEIVIAPEDYTYFAIWNAGPNSESFVPKMVWANLEIVY
jgi:hypothetical protein